MKRGQISLEYLIVVGFVVFVVILLMGVAIYYTSNSRDKIRTNQLANFANKLITSAESVYFAGEPSKVTITVFLPEGVESFNVISDSLVFNMSTDSGIITIAYSSDVPLDNAVPGPISISSGVKRVEISAGTDRVYITEG